MGIYHRAIKFLLIGLPHLMGQSYMTENPGTWTKTISNSKVNRCPPPYDLNLIIWPHFYSNQCLNVKQTLSPFFCPCPVWKSAIDQHEPCCCLGTYQLGNIEKVTYKKINFSFSSERLEILCLCPPGLLWRFGERSHYAISHTQQSLRNLSPAPVLSGHLVSFCKHIVSGSSS